MPDHRPPESDEAFLARLAREIVRRGLSTPAILVLESMKPMNFVSSRVLVFLDPIVTLIRTIPDYRRCVRLLEERDTIERLLCAIEACEEERTHDEGTPMRTAP